MSACESVRDREGTTQVRCESKSRTNLGVQALKNAGFVRAFAR